MIYDQIEDFCGKIKLFREVAKLRMLEDLSEEIKNRAKQVVAGMRENGIAANTSNDDIALCWMCGFQDGMALEGLLRTEGIIETTLLKIEKEKPSDA